MNKRCAVAHRYTGRVPFPVCAITLDLDDTLWPFAPIGLRVEQTLHAWFQTHSPATAARFPIAAMRELREQLILEHPQLAHDVSTLRRRGIERALRESGADPALAEAAYAAFYAERNRVEFYPDALHALQRIAHRYPVAAVTNGNADLHMIGIGGHFAFRIAAHEHGAGKPDPSIFLAACEHLRCDPALVLHVGDDIEADMRGARTAGLHTCWMHRNDAHERHPHWPADAGFAPDMIVNDLTALADWLEHQPHRMST